MYLTERWHETRRLRTAVLLGIVAGLIVLTRHTNALQYRAIFLRIR